MKYLGWFLVGMLTATAASAAPVAWVVLEVFDNGGRVAVVSVCQTRARCEEIAESIHDANAWTIVTQVPTQQGGGR